MSRLSSPGLWSLLLLPSAGGIHFYDKSLPARSGVWFEGGDMKQPCHSGQDTLYSSQDSCNLPPIDHGS